MSTEHPETLGPYRFEAEIAVGGMGAVYRAYDGRLDRRVAIKRIRTGVEDRRPDARERLRREARAVARISHAAVVQVFDFVRHHGEDWIVMEWVDGTPLSELIARDPLPTDQVIRLGREIAEGLDHAHRQGTIHRDLKPENIMLTREGRAKILDFGLAKQVWSGEQEARLTASGAVLGTLRCMSPEQARGLEIDHRSDLFSLGTLLYEMATAIRPFAGQTPLDTLNLVCTHEPPPLRGVLPAAPRDLDSLIEQLMRKEPARRPESAGYVARVLASIDRPSARESSVTEGSALPEIETVQARAFPVRAEPEPRRRALPRVGVWATVLAMPTIAMLAWASTRLERGAYDLDSSSGTIAGAPTEPTARDLYLRGRELLETFYRRQDLQEAILAFERSLDLEPASAAAYAGLSRAFWRRHYAENKDPLWLERALSHARKAVDLDPFLVDARAAHSVALAYLGHLDDAEAALEGVRPIDPENANVSHARAVIFKFRGQHEDAIDAIRTALESDPDNFDFYNFLGSRLTRLSRLDEAAESFRRSIDLAPDSIVAYRNLAGIHHRQGRINEAATLMQTALEIRPTATLYASLGILYFDQGLYRDAAAVFEKAVEIPGGANDFRVWGNLADAYRWTPDHDDKAREAYSRAIALLGETRVDDAEARSRLSMFQAKRGDLEQARGTLARIVETERPSASVSYRIAVTWELLGERDHALEALRRALEAGFPLTAVRRDPELTDLRTDVGFHRSLSFRDGSTSSSSMIHSGS